MNRCATRYAERSSALESIVICLTQRFEITSYTEDLDEAIICDGKCLALYSSSYCDHPNSLRNLRVDVSARFEHVGKVELEDIQEKIHVRRR